MGYMIMTGAYVDTFEHILDTKACPGSCAIATIAASTMTTSTWQNFGQKYQKSWNRTILIHAGSSNAPVKDIEGI
jgi:hypothetical protein